MSLFKIIKLYEMRRMKLFMCMALLATSVLVTSQASAYGGKHPHDTDDHHSNKAPIDGGITLLIGAGVVLGYKKLRDKRKAEKTKSFFA